MDSTKSTDWILENIVKIRKLKNKQGPEMAKALGIAQGTYSKLENGKIKDYYEYLPKIAQVLGVSFHELFSPNGVVQNNYGSIESKGIGLVNHVNIYEDRLADKVIAQLEDTIKILKELNENLKS